MSIQARQIEVTPSLAEKWLKKNTNNRDVDGDFVERYATDMRQGKWVFNGETIKIADTGRILDGQHRLMAICEAGVAITLLVITGLPESTQETMDQGRPRSLGDVFQLRGEKYYSPLATTVTVVWRWEQTGDLLAARVKPTVAEATLFLERNPELRDSTAFAFNRRRPWMPGVYLGPLHFLFSAADQAKADAFVDGLHTGVTRGIEDPVHQLRERLINAYIEREDLPAKNKLALVLKAWAAFYEDRELRLLKWVGSGDRPEAFPGIAGLAGAEEFADAA